MRNAAGIVGACALFVVLPLTAGAYEPPAGCVAWYDGCNWCSSVPGVPGAACTKRACIDEGTSEPARCTEWAPGTEPSGSNEPAEVPPTEDAPPATADVVDTEPGTVSTATSESRSFIATVLQAIAQFFTAIAGWFS